MVLITIKHCHYHSLCMCEKYLNIQINNAQWSSSPNILAALSKTFPIMVHILNKIKPLAVIVCTYSRHTTKSKQMLATDDYFLNISIAFVESLLTKIVHTIYSQYVNVQINNTQWLLYVNNSRICRIIININGVY